MSLTSSILYHLLHISKYKRGKQMQWPVAPSNSFIFVLIYFLGFTVRHTLPVEDIQSSALDKEVQGLH